MHYDILTALALVFNCRQTLPRHCCNNSGSFACYLPKEQGCSLLACMGCVSLRRDPLS